MTGEATYLVVARFVKPHGLAGEALVYPMTDRPDEVYAAGQEVRWVTEDGHPDGDVLVIERSRKYQRRWLLRFEGIEERTPLESWAQGYLGVVQDTLEEPEDDEMYEHEIPGAEVVDQGTVVGVAKGLMGSPANPLLAVDRDGKEVLVPFRPPILVKVDRTARRIDVALPPGLLEL